MVMEGADVGPEGRVDPWVKGAHGPQPLAAPAHLYAPPQDQTDALRELDAWPQTTAPTMVWSAATATWEPAPARPRIPGPPTPPAPRPRFRRSPSRKSRSSSRSSRPLRRRRRTSPARSALDGFRAIGSAAGILAVIL